MSAPPFRAPARIPAPALATAMSAAFALALVMVDVAPAVAAWNTHGDPVVTGSVDEQPGYAFSNVGANIAPDRNGGMFVAWTYPTNGDSIRINRLDGQTAAPAWGANGVKVNVGGNAAGPPHLVADGLGGTWVVWSDTRSGAAGLYVQRYDHDGQGYFPSGGTRFSASLTSNGDIDIDVACTPSGKLLFAWFENGVGLRVSKIDQFGNPGFALGGTIVTTDDTPAIVQLMADGEGAVVTWASDRASLPGNAGLTRVVANRINSTGAVQWGAEGVVVQAGAGVTATDHRSVWDGTRLYACWYQSTSPAGIHAQKLNTSGAALWGSTTTGVTVFNDISTAWDHNLTVPRQPRIVADDAGGAIIAWVDARDYDRPAPNGFAHAQDIYGQRLDTSGSRMWVGTVGAALDSTAGTQYELQAITDRNGGVNLVYTDLSLSSGTTQDDVHARRINGSGASVWHSYLTGIPADGEQFKPRIVGDDATGSAFYAWEDHRDDGTHGADVYASHRSLAGSAAAPVLTVTSPNGGESYFSGEKVNVTWTSTFGYPIGLFWGAGNPSTFIGSLPTADDGQQDWAAPTISGNYRVWALDDVDGLPRDSSNATFSVCSTMSFDHDETGFSHPVALAKGDFNEDGILDVLVCDDNGVHVLKGNGSGGVGNGDFSVTGNLVLTGGARGVVVGDFNDDGRLDFAASFATGVSVWLGNGTGTVGNGSFTANANYPAGTNPSGMTLGDFNEDGVLDLVVANATSNTLSVLLGNGSGGVGNGTFAAAVNYAVGTTPVQVVTGDFNDDGRTDLAVSNDNAASNNVSILLANGTGAVGNGTFAAAVNYAAGQNPYGLATGDFNEDGITDLAVSCNTVNGLVILLGNGTAGVGNGTFAAPASYPVGPSTRDVAVGDFNNDGRADLLAVGASGNAMVFLFGNGTGTTGNGTFTAGAPLTEFFSFPTAVVLGDFKEDGVADELVAIQNGNAMEVRYGECPTALSGTVAVVSPNGGETALIGGERTITWTRGDAVMAVDIELSRDGGVNWERIASHVTGTSLDWTVTGPATALAKVRVVDSNLQNRLDSSDAAFTISTGSLVLTSPNGGNTIPTMSWQQIQWTSNLGGNVKLEFGPPGAARQTITASTPNTGSFLWTVPNAATGAVKVYVTSLDVPAFSDSSNATFGFCTRVGPQTTRATGGATRRIATGDVNGDGIEDAVVANDLGYRVLLGLGSGGVGNGDFSPQASVSVGSGTIDVALADFNSDGILDLVAIQNTNVALMLGQGSGGVGNGTFGSATSTPVAGVAQSLVVRDFNEDGVPDVAVAVPSLNKVDILLGQGSGGVGSGALAAAVGYTAPSTPQEIACADFNEDGILDLAVTCNTSVAIALFYGQGSGGLGNGSFVAGPVYPSPGGAIHVVAGDFNFDGRMDLVVGAGSNVNLFKGNGAGTVGDGTFAAAVSTVLPHGSLNALFVVNFQLDEFAELGAVFNSPSVMTVLDNEGGDTFVSLGDVATGSKPLQVVTGDFNEDGSTDFLSANSFDTNLGVFLGNDCAPGFPNNPITVIGPNGGETLTTGTPFSITFNRDDEPVMVDVDLSRDGGRHWQPIARGVNDYAFTWNVVGPATDSALVRVRDFSTPTWSDVSDGVFRIQAGTVAVDEPSLPREASFSAARPNPARGDARFDLALPRESRVKVEVFDLHGRRVGTLADGWLAAGTHTVRWSDGGPELRTTGPGVYFVHARFGDRDVVRRLIRVE